MLSKLSILPYTSMLVEMAGVEPASELGCGCASTVCSSFF